MRQGKLILLALVHVSAMAADKPSIDFANLERTCVNHWDQFTRDEIDGVRRKVHAWMDGLNTRQVQTLYDANDELVIFTSNFFPSELEGRFTGPDSFADCNALNVNLQRQMSDRANSHEKEIEDYVNCLSNRYDNGDLRKSIIRPLNRFVACYRSQARQFRP